MRVSDRHLDDRLRAQAVYQPSKVIVKQRHEEGRRGMLGKPNAASAVLERLGHVAPATVRHA